MALTVLQLLTKLEFDSPCERRRRDDKMAPQRPSFETNWDTRQQRTFKTLRNTASTNTELKIAQANQAGHNYQLYGKAADTVRKAN